MKFIRKTVEIQLSQPTYLFKLYDFQIYEIRKKNGE